MTNYNESVPLNLATYAASSHIMPFTEKLIKGMIGKAIIKSELHNIFK